MKLLLTSAGLSNKSITNALRDLIGKDFAKTKLVYIPTAANMEEGDKSWLINDLYKYKELNFKEVDIVDIAAVSKEVWQPRIERADVIVFGGGNTAYLMEQIRKSGLEKLLPDLLKTRVYIGTSAGSMVAAPSVKEKDLQKLYEENVIDPGNDEGLGFVDFLVLPHLNSPYFPRIAELVEKVAPEIDIPLYAIDDKTAVQVVDEKIEVISEGKWKKFD